MTATVTRIHPGRPPAAPAPTHAHTCREVVLRGGRLIEVIRPSCLVCGAPLTGLEVVR